MKCCLLVVAVLESYIPDGQWQKVNPHKTECRLPARFGINYEYISLTKHINGTQHRHHREQTDT
jgi:hypothetical protein